MIDKNTIPTSLDYEGSMTKVSVKDILKNLNPLETKTGKALAGAALVGALTLPQVLKKTSNTNSVAEVIPIAQKIKNSNANKIKPDGELTKNKEFVKIDTFEQKVNEFKDRIYEYSQKKGWSDKVFMRFSEGSQNNSLSTYVDGNKYSIYFGTKEKLSKENDITFTKESREDDVFMTQYFVEGKSVSGRIAISEEEDVGYNFEEIDPDQNDITESMNLWNSIMDGDSSTISKLGYEYESPEHKKLMTPIREKGLSFFDRIQGKKLPKEFSVRDHGDTRNIDLIYETDNDYKTLYIRKDDDGNISLISTNNYSWSNNFPSHQLTRSDGVTEKVRIDEYKNFKDELDYRDKLLP